MKASTRFVVAAGLLALGASVASAGEKIERLSLLPGDQAPPLEVTSWVRGEEVTSLDKGVYVVDFWATWCMPCIMSMPHLTSVQQSHSDSVTVLAVNVMEDKELSRDQRIEKVHAKVKELGDKMSFRVAIDGDGTMENTWLRAGGAPGIPWTFIVKDRKIEWIGSPYMGFDDALESVLAGEFDVDAYRVQYKEMREPEVRIAELRDLLREGKYDAFYKTANAYLDTYLKDNADQLNAFAWDIATSEKVKQRDLNFAEKAAKRACELTEWKDPSIVDTYAHVLFARGDIEGAIKYEKKALDLCGPDTDERLTDAIKKALKKFQGEAKEASIH